MLPLKSSLPSSTKLNKLQSDSKQLAHFVPVSHAQGVGQKGTTAPESRTSGVATVVIRRDPEGKGTSSQGSLGMQCPLLYSIWKLVLCCLLHALPDFLVIKPSSLGTQRVSPEKFALKAKHSLFLHDIPLWKGKSAEEPGGL